MRLTREETKNYIENEIAFYFRGTGDTFYFNIFKKLDGGCVAIECIPYCDSGAFYLLRKATPQQVLEVVDSIASEGKGVLPEDAIEIMMERMNLKEEDLEVETSLT